jgi:sigma-E factor negative regulatory protein RseA
MSEQLKESVSALMDGEADELELRRLLTKENSGLVDGQWSRYHLVRDVLQNDSQEASFRHLDISMQVSEAIGEKPLSTIQSARSKLWQPIARFAVAASVAVVVVIGVQSTQQQPLGIDDLEVGTPSFANNKVYPVQGASMQASTGSNTGMIRYPSTVLPGAMTVSSAEADLEVEKRLDMYILRHTEQSALNNSQGMLPFSRVSSLEAK